MRRYSPSRSPRRSRSRSIEKYQPKEDFSDRYRADSRDRYGGGGGGGSYRDRGGDNYRDRIVERDDRYNDRYARDDRYKDRFRERSSDRRNNDDSDQCRIHIADLTDSVTQYDIEKAFMKFGEIREVWMAKNPPCFAFVVFKTKQDAALAVKEMDQKVVGYNRVKVTFARPRTRGRKRRWDPNMRCYQCGERGHFSRDCDGGRGRRNESSSRRRNSRRTRSRSFSRSRTPRNRDHGSNGIID